MKEILGSLLFGYSEILRWNTVKYALVSGIILSILWIGVGTIFWDTIINISNHILGWLPFSMIRSDGASMLSAFLWLQMILLTFALFFVFFGNLVLRHIPKERYTTFSLLVAFGSTTLWSVVWLLKGDYLHQQFLKFLTSLPFDMVEEGISFLLAFYLIYNAIIVSMVFVTSLFSKPLISSIEEREFSDTPLVKGHIYYSVVYTIKDTLIFLALSILVLPLLFVPILNIITQSILWIWLTKDTISHNALSLTHKNIDKEYIKSHRKAIWFISFIATLFNFVPVLNLFGPFFGEITMFHYFRALHQGEVDRRG